MVIKVTLPQKVLKYWEQYGNIADVIERLLLETDWMNVPQMPCEDTKHIKRYIDVTNDDYLSAREIFNASNPCISLSRLLIYNYEIDYATRMGWKPINNKFLSIYNEVSKLLKSADTTDNEKDILKEIIKCITT